MKGLKFIRTNGKIFNNVDFSEIANKIDRYKSWFEFRNDFSWIVHNCAILHTNDKDIINVANELLDYVDEEILSVTKCSQCYKYAYEDMESSFIKPCDKPHPLIWSKPKGYVYWPAKCMSVIDGIVHVRYFGEHTTENVPIEKCYLFSKKEPVQIKKENRSNNYFEAIEVFHSYLKIIYEM